MAHKKKLGRKTDRIQTLHTPPLARHLNHFGFKRDEEDLPQKLSALTDLEEAIEDCESPEEAVELSRRFPFGIQSRSILVLEFMEAGMGGCGAMDVGVLFDPGTGFELLCWLDMENYNAKIVASFEPGDTLWVGKRLVELVLQSLGQVAVQNDALTRIENRLPKEVPKE